MPFQTVSAVVFNIPFTVLFPDFAYLHDLALAHGSQFERTLFCRLGAQQRIKVYATQPLSPYAAWFGNWYAQAGVAERAMTAVFDSILERQANGMLWTTPASGIKRLLHRLRATEVQIAAVNSGGEAMRKHLQECGLDGYFNKLIDVKAIAASKTDARLYQHALVSLDSSAKDCAYVSEWSLPELVAAETAGLRTLVYDPYDVVEDGSRIRIQDFAGFSALPS